MKRKFSFTLVELLIVVSIIILLIAILLPALGKAKAQANRIHCAGNLKQLGSASAMYWNDNNGYAMDYLCGPSHGNGWYDWYGPLKQLGYIPNIKGVKGTILDCKGVPDTTTYAYYTKYAYAVSIFVNAKRVERVTRTSARVLFTCSSTYVITWDTYNTRLYPAHNKAPNFSFIDGHVSWFKEPTYGSSSILFRSWFHTTGRFD